MSNPETLIDQVVSIWMRLMNHGWRDLLLAHGLDLGPVRGRQLAKLLEKPLDAINRQIPGFEDFAADGVRGIEPGSPARSLFYHALASPQVHNRPSGKRLTRFPTLTELEIVENYVFASARVSLASLSSKVKAGKQLRVMVFAYEYRPASQTCHGRHADMTYARTGIARVGTAEAEYLGPVRGFLPQSASDPHAIRVLPARYAAYLAVPRTGNPREFIPMRFRERPSKAGDHVPRSDAVRTFWVPVHKLFSGGECLTDVDDLTVRFSSRHFNEKIYCVHASIDAPRTPREYPYQFSDGIAEFSTAPGHGPGLLMPVPHEHLVEPARTREGAWATYPVDEDRIVEDYSSYSPNEQDAANKQIRPAPQYVNAKIEVDADGHLRDLNNDPRYARLIERASLGEYRALHFVDFTGDGWVQVQCPQLEERAEIACGALAAYSLVTAPDFFPFCDQRELSAWSESSAIPRKIRDSIWGQQHPDALSDQRWAANLQLPVTEGENPFDPHDDSMTALVPLLGKHPAKGHAPPISEAQRHSHLPDDAAGIFDPGWDVSLDQLGDDADGIEHLASYGLGSPFPEDVRLCAALSTFWPGASPDITRVMEPVPDPGGLHTVCPLTDAEIGQRGDLPWDGVRGPKVVNWQGEEHAEFVDAHRIDYVQNALRNQFSMRLLAQIDSTEYQNRVLAMTIVHHTLSPRPEVWDRWIVLSFRPVVLLPRANADVQSESPLPKDLDEMKTAQDVVELTMQAPVYRFEIFARSGDRKEYITAPYDFRKRLLPIKDKRIFFVSPQEWLALWRKVDDTTWRAEPLNLRGKHGARRNSSKK